MFVSGNRWVLTENGKRVYMTVQVREKRWGRLQDGAGMVLCVCLTHRNSHTFVIITGVGIKKETSNKMIYVGARPKRGTKNNDLRWDRFQINMKEGVVYISPVTKRGQTRPNSTTWLSLGPGEMWQEQNGVAPRLGKEEFSTVVVVMKISK